MKLVKTSNVTIGVLILLFGVFSARREPGFRLSFSMLQILKGAYKQIEDEHSINYFPPPVKALDSQYCEIAIAIISEQSNVFSNNKSGLRDFVLLACLDDAQVVQLIIEQPGRLIKNSSSALYFSEVLRRANQLKAAESVWRRFPEISIFFGYLGKISIEKDQDEVSALEYFRLSYAIEPRIRFEKQGMYLYACLISVRENRVMVGIQPCQDFYDVEHSSLSALLLGRTFFAEADFQRAKQYLTEAIAMDPSSGEAYYWAAKTEVEIKRVSRARQFVREGIEHDPNYVWNHILLSELNISEGDVDSAINGLREVLLIAKTNNDYSAQQVIDAKLRKLSGTE